MRVFVQVSEAGQLLLYVTHICTGLQQTHTFINIHVFSGSSTQGTLFNEESVSVEVWLTPPKTTQCFGFNRTKEIYSLFKHPFLIRQTLIGHFKTLSFNSAAVFAIKHFSVECKHWRHYKMASLQNTFNVVCFDFAGLCD